MVHNKGFEKFFLRCGFFLDELLVKLIAGGKQFNRAFAQRVSRNEDLEQVIRQIWISAKHQNKREGVRGY